MACPVQEANLILAASEANKTPMEVERDQRIQANKMMLDLIRQGQGQGQGQGAPGLVDEAAQPGGCGCEMAGGILKVGQCTGTLPYMASQL